MKRKYIALFAYILLAFSANAEFLYKSFDESMHIPKGFHKNSDYIFLEKIYESNNPKILTSNPRNTIPKIIHQIWLGPKQIPKKHLEYSKEWQKLHPDWEYKLWTEKEIENWNFGSKDLFNKAASYQEKSNLLRYEILIKYGGLFLDFDYKPFKNFDAIHSRYDFYGTTEPIISKTGDIIISDALVASVPNNKIFYDTLKRIRSHWDQQEILFRSAAKNIKKKKNLIHLSVNRCMIPFGRAVIDNINQETSIIFPTSYMGMMLRDKMFDKIRIKLGLISKKLYFRIPKAETMAAQKRGERVISDLNNIGIQDPWYKKISKKFEKYLQ